MYSFKDLRAAVRNNDIVALEEIIKSEEGWKYGAWLWTNVPTDEEYDDMFSLVEASYMVEDAKFYQKNGREYCRSIGMRKAPVDIEERLRRLEECLKT